MKPYQNKINIISTLKFLGNLEINNLWVEAGGNLSGSLLKMKLIDEIIIYIAPKILGHEAKPLFFLDYIAVGKLDLKKTKKILTVKNAIREMYASRHKTTLA